MEDILLDYWRNCDLLGIVLIGHMFLPIFIHILIPIACKIEKRNIGEFNKVFKFARITWMVGTLTAYIILLNTLLIINISNIEFDIIKVTMLGLYVILGLLVCAIYIVNILINNMKKY